MTDRPFAGGEPASHSATAGTVGDHPTPGYYPDPSIPGFVRYWGGTGWVPGTSRPTPEPGEVLEPPRFVHRPAAPRAGARRPVPASSGEPGGGAGGEGGVPSGSGDGAAGGGGSSGDTGLVYFDQTMAGTAFTMAPQAEVELRPRGDLESFREVAEAAAPLAAPRAEPPGLEPARGPVVGGAALTGTSYEPQPGTTPLLRPGAFPELPQGLPPEARPVPQGGQSPVGPAGESVVEPSVGAGGEPVVGTGGEPVGAVWSEEPPPYPWERADAAAGFGALPAVDPAVGPADVRQADFAFAATESVISAPPEEFAGHRADAGTPATQPSAEVPEPVGYAAEAGEPAVGATSGTAWQADPSAQRGLLETGGAPRWVSWGVLPTGAQLADQAVPVEPERPPVAAEAFVPAAAPAAPSGPTRVEQVPAPGTAGDPGRSAAAAPAVPSAGAAAGAAGVEAVPRARRAAEVRGSAGRTAESGRPAAPQAAPQSVTGPAAAGPRARGGARTMSGRRRPTPALPTAGLGRRLLARLVDTAVLAVVAAAAAVPLATSALGHLQQKVAAAEAVSRVRGHRIQVWLVDPLVLGKAGALLAVLVLFGFLYEVRPTARSGQTFGKRLARIKVVDTRRPEPPSGARSFVRWLVRQLGVLVPVGLLWPLFDRRNRRGWQDRAARTRVVRI
ncbi:RDD family protein [Kitasatospora camelliae]|uniref:RDD family protein n=1 Tax=Kitasatospora camelliae TaxID=3156397 RepID=A0AAU8JVC3_9ACTN